MEIVLNNLIKEIEIHNKVIKVSFEKVFIEKNVLYLSVNYDTKHFNSLILSERILNHLLSNKIQNIKKYIGLNYSKTVFKKDDHKTNF